MNGGIYQATTASHHHSHNVSSLSNVSSLTTPMGGKAVTQSRLEKAKQLARNQHHHHHHNQSSSSSSSNQASYLPPSPISSTCSVSNLSSLSSSVSVSPSSLSSSPSSMFNSNNTNNIYTPQQSYHQHMTGTAATTTTTQTESSSAATAAAAQVTQNMILSNLLPFYANNDYLKNLISTVYALTSYQHQQQQLQQQQQYNEQLRSSFANLTKPVALLLQQQPQANFPSSITNTNMDVSSQVDEHFRRSLGAAYFNTIFSQQSSKTKATKAATTTVKKNRLASHHLTSKKSKLITSSSLHHKINRGHLQVAKSPTKSKELETSSKSIVTSISNVVVDDKLKR
jgi:hypothetical protein